MPETCVNTTWLDGKISSVREVEQEDWMIGADIKSNNWTGKGGYRSLYDCEKKR